MSSICARITDMHACALFTGPVPHVGGPVVGPGAVTVLVGYLPAAQTTNVAICVGPPDTLLMASATVIVGGLPCVRIGIDATAHGGVVVAPGCPTVIVGG